MKTELLVGDLGYGSDENVRRELLAETGVKIYKLSAEDEQALLEITNKTGWDMLLEKAPDAAALKPLMSK